MPRSGQLPLTKRQTAVLHSLFIHGSIKRAARHCNRSPATVKNHLLTIYRKLSAENMVEAIYKALSLGLITAPSGDAPPSIIPPPVFTEPRVCDWLTVGNLKLSPSMAVAVVAHAPLQLHMIGIKLLAALAYHPGMYYSRGRLLDEVYGIGQALGQRVVDSHVSRLRKTLHDAGCDHTIATRRGHGYGLVPGSRFDFRRNQVY